jgi:hypothetical protein
VLIIEYTFVCISALIGHRRFPGLRLRPGSHARLGVNQYIHVAGVIISIIRMFKSIRVHYSNMVTQIAR